MNRRMKEKHRKQEQMRSLKKLDDFVHIILGCPKTRKTKQLGRYHLKHRIKLLAWQENVIKAMISRSTPNNTIIHKDFNFNNREFREISSND